MSHDNFNFPSEPADYDQEFASLIADTYTDNEKDLIEQCEIFTQAGIDLGNGAVHLTGSDRAQVNDVIRHLFKSVNTLFWSFSEISRLTIESSSTVGAATSLASIYKKDENKRAEKFSEICEEVFGGHDQESDIELLLGVFIECARSTEESVSVIGRMYRMSLISDVKTLIEAVTKDE